MFSDGSFALALVRSQVTLVQTTRSHTKDEKYLNVHTYTPFGQGVFLTSEVPNARIASSDVLSLLPSLEGNDDQGMLELPQTAFSQYVELTSRHTQRHETLWKAWVSKH